MASKVSMRSLAFLSLALVTILSLSATFAPGNVLLRAVEFVPGGDVTIHFVMLGLTAFAVTKGFSRPTRPLQRRIAPSAVLLIVATAEEFSQRWILGRSFSLDDMLANTAGIVVFTSLALLGRSAAATSTDGPIQPKPAR